MMMKKKDDWKVILLFLCFMVAKKITATLQ